MLLFCSYIYLGFQTLRYIQYSKGYVLNFEKAANQESINMFTDDLWGSDPDNFRSFISYVLKTGNSTVAWFVKTVQRCEVNL